MNNWNYKSAKVGNELPSMEIDSISEDTLSKYAEASGDYNPIHLDCNYAKKIGLDGVIAHGMLIMAYLGKTLTENIKQDNILEYGVKFSSMVNIGDNLLCTGYVDDIFKKNSKTLLKIKLGVKDQNGDKKLDGYTIVDIP
mgnify:FL=1